MTVAAVAVLLTLSLAALPAWRGLPPTRRRKLRAAVAVGGALTALGVAGLLAVPQAQVGATAATVVVSAAMCASVCAGGPVAAAVLRLADPTPPDARAPAPGPADPGVLRGGAWIGVLERIAITGTLLAGWPEGLALTLAVKGLGRYPELRAPGAAERFIIGTFTSVLWACGCAGVAVLLLR